MAKKEILFTVSRDILLNANVSRHYHDKGNRARALRAMANEIGTEIKEQEDVFFEHFKVTVYICPPTRRRMDPPNLYPTIKHLIDGLTDAGWWEDDDWTRLDTLSFKYGGLSEVKNHYQVRMIIEEIEKEVSSNE